MRCTFLALGLLVAKFAAAQTIQPITPDDRSGQMGRDPQPTKILIGSSFTKEGRVRISLGSWLKLARHYYPAPNSKAAQSFSEALKEGDEGKIYTVQPYINAAVSNPKNWKVTEMLPNGSTANVRVGGVQFSVEQGFAYLEVARRSKATLKFEVMVYSAVNGGSSEPGWLTLYNEASKKSFEVDMSKVSSAETTYDLNDATDAKLIGGDTANVKRLSLDFKGTYGTHPIEFKAIASTNDRDLEGKYTLSTTSRYLVDVDRFQTFLFGASYEANQRFTNHLVSAKVGTRSFLNTVPGVSNFGLAGSRGFVDLALEEGYWLRQDRQLVKDNASKVGTWVTGQLSIGPNFIHKGNTAFFINAIGYYFPEKDRKFGFDVQPFEGFIELGFLAPLGHVSKDDPDQNLWLKFSFKDGAERANSFARAHSLEFTLSKRLSF